MSVSSISSVNNVPTDNVPSALADRRKNLQALDSALESGDLQAAQSAFGALQQSVSSQSAASGTVASAKTSQFAADLQAVGQALQSGDLQGAQQALAAMKQHRHHGGHHRHASKPGGTSPTPAPTALISADGSPVGGVISAKN
jgi:hypothetical protein